jgi:hypothetical protein
VYRPGKPVGLVAVAVLGLAGVACTQTLDAGWTGPRGLLPVDERNPILLVNDGPNDNWQGEYAVLLASGGGPRLAGIVVNVSGPWPDIEANVAGWRDLVAAARASGLRNLPDPIASVGAALVRPASGDVAATRPNRSEGARLIVEASRRFSLPQRPLVVVTGGALTDVADAYLMDPSVAERVIVVSSLGTVTATGGGMSAPNGEMDPWADAIVTARLRYVQVSAFYDQIVDVPAEDVSRLPANAFGARIAAKQPNVWDWPPAADQVGVVAVGVAGFVTAVDRVRAAGSIPAGASAGPDLLKDPDGPGWLVTACQGAAAKARLWQILLDPQTFAP